MEVSWKERHLNSNWLLNSIGYNRSTVLVLLEIFEGEK